MEGHWQEGPKGVYHRKCYQVYTDKSKVERAEKQQQFDENDPIIDESPESERRISRSQFQLFDNEKCAICQKVKIKKGTKSREPLTLNLTKCASASLSNAAQIRNDERLLKEIHGKDTIALEIKYHKSCYRDYVRQSSLDSLEKQNCEEEDTVNSSYNIAFEKLRKLVRVKVFEQAQAVNMSELLQQYTTYLSSV